METPKPMQGAWTLTAPDGRAWQGDSPIRTVAMEQRDRVPAKVAVQRIYAANDQPPQQHILDQIERCRTTAYAAGHHYAQHGAHDPALMTKQAQDEALLIHLIDEYAAASHYVDTANPQGKPSDLEAAQPVVSSQPNQKVVRVGEHNGGDYDMGRPDQCDVECVLGYLKTDEAAIRAGSVDGVWADTMARAADMIRTHLQSHPSSGVREGGERCPYCNDSGDVHDQIGQWHGRCTCPAGTASPDPQPLSTGSPK